MKIYKKQETKNVVYFIKKGNGLVKIGTTIHFKKRKRALETQNGEIFKEYFMVEGSYALESYFHKKYSKERVIGEWFNIDFNNLYIDIKNENTNITNKQREKYIDRKIDLTIEYTFSDIISNYLINNEKYLKDNFTCSIDDFIKEYIIENKDIIELEEINESIEEFKSYNTLYDYIERYLLPCNVDYITNVFYSDFINDKIDIKYLCCIFLEHLEEICNSFNFENKKNLVWIKTDELFEDLEIKFKKYIDSIS